MNLPEEYVISKFYEFGYRVKYHKYNNTYNCACPVCREGKSFLKKKRCFYLPKKNLVYCHNCGWSSAPYKWIRKVSGITHQELLKELDDGDYNIGIDLEEKVTFNIEVPDLPEDSINLCDTHQVEYYKNDNIVRGVLDVISERRLHTAVNKCKNLYVSLKDRVHRHRLIIPFLDSTGSVVHYQSRKVFHFDTKEKYISKINSDRTIFNIDQVTTDFNEVFIFEGPLDSFFVKNGVAVGGINTGRELFTGKQAEQMQAALMFFERVWILDSQWLDDTSLKKSETLLKKGESVFIWPHRLGSRYKDFNETCVALGLNEICCDYIKENTFKHFEGVLKLGEIKKLRERS